MCAVDAAHRQEHDIFLLIIHIFYPDGFMYTYTIETQLRTSDGVPKVSYTPPYVNAYCHLKAETTE